MQPRRSVRTWGWVGAFCALALLLSAPAARAASGVADVSIVTDDTGSRLLVELNKMGKTVLVATHDLSLIRAAKVRGVSRNQLQVGDQCWKRNLDAHRFRRTAAANGTDESIAIERAKHDGGDPSAIQ